ncbi:MAG TPA: hypothetical protein VEV41_17205 [Terriglobales bacterium]|nr:hypothetical protein [Terriglobales bacterium]
MSAPLHFFELGANVVRSQLIASCARATAFQQIVRKKLHVRANTFHPDALEYSVRRKITG